MSDNIVEKLRWYQSFAPSTITFHNIRTGKQVQEPSLAALDISGAGKGKLPPYAIGEVSAPLPMERCRAVGNAALDYRDISGVVVFSPLRNGQIADYAAAQHLFRVLFRQVRSGIGKPILCVHILEHTTEVEERALIDAGIQMGARRVLLYRESFSAMRDRARSDPKLRRGYILHIEPQDE
ncbi:MAG: hypothetical protein HDT16_00610 [Oscillibacter sp.]|nr:hypothetical protein [Oscillibacter sp.]